MNNNSGPNHVFTAHLAAFLARDVNAIVSGYHPDAVLYTPNGPVRGHQAIRETFSEYFEKVLPAGSRINVRYQADEKEMAYVIWEASAPRFDILLASDTFCIRDGKIVWQTYVAVVNPKPELKLGA